MTGQTDNAPTEPVSFDEALRVEGEGGEYRGLVHPSWDGPLTTHGGLLAALAMRSVELELAGDDEFVPRSITCHYLRPPKHGPIDIHVEQLRAGRRFTTARATISQGDQPCVVALLMLAARALPSVDEWSIAAPDVDPAPGPDAERVPASSFPLADGGGWLEIPKRAPQFFQRLLIAPRFGTGPFMGPAPDPNKGTQNGGWVQLPDTRPVDAAWLVFLVDAFWPSVLEPMRAPAIAPTLDLTIHLRTELPVGGLPDQPLLVHNQTIALESGLSDSDSRVFTADGRLLAQGRQSQLVAPLES